MLNKKTMLCILATNFIACNFTLLSSALITSISTSNKCAVSSAGVLPSQNSSCSAKSKTWTSCGKLRNNKWMLFTATNENECKQYQNLAQCIKTPITVQSGHKKVGPKKMIYPTGAKKMGSDCSIRDLNIKMCNYCINGIYASFNAEDIEALLDVLENDILDTEALIEAEEFDDAQNALKEKDFPAQFELIRKVTAEKNERFLTDIVTKYLGLFELRIKAIEEALHLDE